MQDKEEDKTGTVIKGNISYYNEIAGSYDTILDEDHSNETVRKKVAQVFCDTVPKGIVLDFGGGTGRDLDWLCRQQYKIIFCEPAAAMRQKAILYNDTALHNASINFLTGDKTDFSNWDKTLPFIEKTDAVLLNFAVLNCIPGITLLFKQLFLVTKPGAHIFALILQHSFKKRYTSNFKGTVLSLLTGATVTYDIHFNGKRQQVYIHSAASIKKKAAKYFSFNSVTTIQGSGFSLLHLIRK